MSRGGRFAGGRPRGPNVPFDIDPELQQAVDKAEDEGRSSESDSSKDLFPVQPNPVVAPPVSKEERRAVQAQRRIQAQRRAGPFWTGTKEQWAEADDSRSAGERAFFEAVQTYSRKRAPKRFVLTDLKRVKVCYPELFPKELRDVVTESADGSAQRKKTLGAAQKSAAAKLSRLDENDPGKELTDQATTDDEEGKEEDEDDFEREPQDDDFDEEDDEGDNDYNAEKYFDDGEADFDEGDGGDYGDDGY